METPPNAKSAANINTAKTIRANDWFRAGKRVSYDTKNKKFMLNGETDEAKNIVQIFTRIDKDETQTDGSVWASFMPGWPDGSYGWSRVNQHLSGQNIGHRLFFDYVGLGDSDKPANYRYSTIERADMMEALWKANGIKSTFIFSFDYSSLVTLELLCRQEDLIKAGIEPETRIEGVLLMNGGLYADGHSHPWFTTPILKSWMGGFVTSLAQRSKTVFAELMKPLWSKDYKVTAEEIEQLFDAIGRRNGIYAMSKSADFVSYQKKNANTLDLSRIYRNARDAVSFHVVGSEQDPFEGRQAYLAKERLGAEGLDVRILPGGHLTTSEHPDLIAEVIMDVGPSSEKFKAAKSAREKPLRETTRKLKAS